MPVLKSLSTSEIRKKYLDFFASKEHLILPSYSVIAPDATTMFTVAGMQPFKSQFMGAKAEFSGKESKRVTTIQKCVRVDDIENVGRTRRHLSLFEMMGNFSFGDYFKKEAIDFAWEFLTSKDWLGLDKNKIYITIYKDDEEAFTYWQGHGVLASHIHRFDADENFWPADAPLKGPNGPCGPCSEIYYDRGDEYGKDTWEDYANTRESARFLEIWNLVFPEFDRQGLEDGKPVLAPLSNKNIDTGLGLERIASIMQNCADFYTNDVFLPLIQKIEELSGKKYEGEKSISHRVIAEHARSVSVIVGDGVNFSNTGRGYVVRKILRRASRHAYLLGITEPIICKLVHIVVNKMSESYPEIAEQENKIQETIKAEEIRFLNTLSSGIARLESFVSNLKGNVLSGEDAFLLYDTYGFPLDLTIEILEEKNITVDLQAYKKSMLKAQELARSGSNLGKTELFDKEIDSIKDLPQTKFLGYDQKNTQAKIIALIPKEDCLTVVFDKTVFYAESGGQISDKGILKYNQEIIEVFNVRKNNGIWLHDVANTNDLDVNQVLEMQIWSDRQLVAANHTATHLLHAALQKVLGQDAKQMGSLVSNNRLRFDFSHQKGLTKQEIIDIENLVNAWIMQNNPVIIQEMTLEEAKNTKATMLFGEKYGEIVRVVNAGTLKDLDSVELCGGTHVINTGDIGAFVIINEENVSAGVRRIEALTGLQAIQYIRNRIDILGNIANNLKTSPEQLFDRITAFQIQIKSNEKEISLLKSRLAEQSLANIKPEQKTWKDYTISLYRLEVEQNILKDLVNKIKFDTDFLVILSKNFLAIKTNKTALEKNAHAGKLASYLANASGSKGGGRSDMAQAGVGDYQKIIDVLG